jgi:hypothetical protein
MTWSSSPHTFEKLKGKKDYVKMLNKYKKTELVDLLAGMMADDPRIATLFQEKESGMSVTINDVLSSSDEEEDNYPWYY